MTLIIKIVFLIMTVIFFLGSIAVKERDRAIINLVAGIVLSIFLIEITMGGTV